MKRRDAKGLGGGLEVIKGVNSTQFRWSMTGRRSMRRDDAVVGHDNGAENRII